MNLRLVLACVLAVSVGLPNSAISVAKVLVSVACVGVLLWPTRAAGTGKPAELMCTPVAVLLALAAMALTLFWTTATLPEGLVAFSKHGKLLLIPLLIVLIRSRRDAVIALWAFGATQVFLLLSSWLLVMKLPVPWATSREALTDYAVFSAYLDQSIMTAVVAAMCWHLRALAPWRWGLALVAGIAALALGNTLFVMQGRTGHAVAIAMLSLAISWQLPRRLRWFGVLVPFLIGLLLVVSSAPVRERAELAANEAIAYIAHSNKHTSSGERLNYWRRSVQALEERPLAGFGVGSFNVQYNRIDAGAGNAQTFTARNPHQEFLLWGVEAGLGGILLLCSVLGCIYRDSRDAERDVARAIQSVLAALVIACLFNSTLFDAAIGDFFCVALGLLLALGRHSPFSRAPPPSRGVARSAG